MSEEKEIKILSEKLSSMSKSELVKKFLELVLELTEQRDDKIGENRSMEYKISELENDLDFKKRELELFKIKDSRLRQEIIIAKEEIERLKEEIKN